VSPLLVSSSFVISFLSPWAEFCFLLRVSIISLFSISPLPSVLFHFVLRLGGGGIFALRKRDWFSYRPPPSCPLCDKATNCSRH
jgi:hypothetical protein